MSNAQKARDKAQLESKIAMDFVVLVVDRGAADPADAAALDRILGRIAVGNDHIGGLIPRALLTIAHQGGILRAKAEIARAAAARDDELSASREAAG